MPQTTTGARAPLTAFPAEAIRHALRLVRWHRAFIRSDATEARIPGDVWKGTMTRQEAQERLRGFIDRAVNERGGLADCRGRKDCPDYQTRLRRDRQAVRDRVLYRRRVYRLETPEARARFAHLLSRHDD